MNQYTLYDEHQDQMIFSFSEPEELRVWLKKNGIEKNLHLYHVTEWEEELSNLINHDAEIIQQTNLEEFLLKY
jgi:hypothetical protein